MDDPLWDCYKTFGEASVDKVEVNKLARFIAGADASHKNCDEIEERILKIRSYRYELRELLKIPLIAQRTTEWYDLRKNRLTASDTAQAMGVGKFGSREQLIIKKAFGDSSSLNMFSPPLKWGTMFEAMATRCYSQRHGDIIIHEFGLIPHPTLSCYGASPDGITELGVMIEIKCPYRRKITGEVPSYYELQMQGQLAVCKLQECDFVECDMQEYSDMDDYLTAFDGGEIKDHGVIAEFRNEEKTEIKYEYSEPLLTSSQAYRSMEVRSSQYMKNNPNYFLFKLRPWSLRFMSVRKVMFDDKRWNEEIAPQIQQFWNDVLKRRAEGRIEEPVSPSKEFDIRTPRKKEVVDFIDDDD